MKTKYTVVCNGKINNNGTCEKCGKQSFTSGGYCIELIEELIEEEVDQEIQFWDTDISSGTSNWDPWSFPYLIDTIPREKSIELIYRQDSNISYSPEMRPIEERIRIYKIIYSCKKGKWHVSDPIYGNYVEAIEESYEFL